MNQYIESLIERRMDVIGREIEEINNDLTPLILKKDRLEEEFDSLSRELNG